MPEKNACTRFQQRNQNEIKHLFTTDFPDEMDQQCPFSYTVKCDSQGKKQAYFAQIDVKGKTVDTCF